MANLNMYGGFKVLPSDLMTCGCCVAPIIRLSMSEGSGCFAAILKGASPRPSTSTCGRPLERDKILSYPQERDVYASESVDQVMFIVVGAAFI